MFATLEKRLRDKENLGKQTDLIMEQYQCLMRDYAEVKSQFQELKFRKLQLQKQIDNLKVWVKEIDDEKSL